MYVSFEDIRTFELVGRDRDGAEDVLGTLDDVYVDTRDWRVSWLVLETGGWLASHKVLIGSDRHIAFDTAGRRLLSELTRYDIETAPEADEVRTVSDRRGGDGVLPPGASLFRAGGPGVALPFGYREGAGLAAESTADPVAPPTEEERHLRSAREMIGYALAGRDGAVGPVRDLLLDGERPAIAWLVVDTGSWLAGHEVVLGPDHVERVSWDERRIGVDLVREQVRGAPPLENLDGLARADLSPLARLYRFPRG